MIRIFTLILIFLCSCNTNVTKKDHTSIEVQSLIDKTYEKMIFVEGGSFMMGDPRQAFADALGKDAWTQYFTSDRNVPVHRVKLDSYYMGAYEVTYADYDIYSNAVGKDLVLKKYLARAGNVRSPQNPVGVGWHSANDYCLWLGEKTGLSFALPTEAQWEFAARNRGQLVVFATNNGKIERGVNFPEHSKYPQTVGSFPPNPLGIYDLSGNAIEWVNDWYQKDYYAHSPEKNPQGPATGTEKVKRGGGAYLGPQDSTTVVRSSSPYLDKNYPSTSFRCVINTDEPLPIKD